MASSSLRSRILQHALPHVPEHSFTIQPLIRSLRSLPPTGNSTDTQTSSSSSKPEPETVTRNTLDILFGSELNARQELVKAWEEEGLRDMVKSGSETTHRAGETRGVNGTSSHGNKGELGVIADLLARRLEYSSRIGEHLVEVCLIPIHRSSDHYLHQHG